MKKILATLLAALMLVSVLCIPAFAAEAEEAEAFDVSEEPEEGVCEYEIVAPIMNGTFKLKLGGIVVGFYKVDTCGEGWSLKNAEGRYLAFARGKIYTSETEFEWTYEKNCFFVFDRIENKNRTFLEKLLGINKYITVKYFLSATPFGGVDVSFSDQFAKAEFIKKITAKSHTFTDWESNGPLTHSHVCKKCNLKETENHTFDPETKKCVCGEYEPGYRTIEINVAIQKKALRLSRYLPVIYYYQTDIHVRPIGVVVSSVEYSMNGTFWQTGTSFVSEWKVDPFYIRITELGGKARIYRYNNGTITMLGE